MIIKSIYIKEFGAIKNLSLDFSDSLNIIEGFNESGKSTVLSFIKFMLYGLPKKSQTERERALSWNSGIAEGTMTVDCKDGSFKIERGAKSGIRGEALRIIDLATGTQVHKGENPGDLFFGVPASVFDSTACVGQLQCSNIDGENIGNALENILLTADETTNTKKAVEKIESLRKKLLHKNRKGGSIFNLMNERDTLKARLETATQKSMKIMEDEAMFESLENQCAEYKGKLEESKKLFDAYERRQLLIRFDGLHSTKKRTKAISDERAELLKNNAPDGFTPSRAFVTELTATERVLRATSSEKAAREKDLAIAKESLPTSSKKAELASKIEELGGDAAICFSFVSNKEKSTHRCVTAIVFLVLAILSVTALAASLSILPVKIPEFFSTVMEHKLFNYIAGAAFVILSLLSIIGFVSSSSHSRKAKKLCLELGIAKDSDEKELRAFISDCLDEKNRLETASYRVKSAESALEECEKNYRACLAASNELLKKCGETLPSEASEKDAADFINGICKKQSELCDKLEVLDRDFQKYNAVYEERLKDVAGVNEDELRASLSPEMLEKLSEINISVLRREYDFMRAKADSAEQKKYAYDRELIALRATAENPLRPQALLAEVEQRLEKEAFMHDALLLAAESIEEASESFRRGVTPKLRSRAGEIMNSLTDGRYTGIGIGADFSVTAELDGETRAVELLSTGTKDAAFLAVRLALISVLYRAEHPSVLLDEALSQIDDKRASEVLKMLKTYCDGGVQCLLFTCHSRESQMSDGNLIRLG